MHLATLDDEGLQREMIQQATQSLGHVCHAYATGDALLQALSGLHFDLLVVDWELPDMSGPEVVRQVRAQGLEVPILFVTHRDAEADVVYGLGCGADDFMVKPVRIGELQARITALLRRAYPAHGSQTWQHGNYCFYMDSRTLLKDGVAVELKHREFELALYLFQHLDRLITREQLREIVWGQNADVQSRSIDTHISRLRNTLDLRPANGLRISAVYGVGYRMETVHAPNKLPLHAARAVNEISQALDDSLPPHVPTIL